MEFFLYILIGFAAQVIDGTMGMAYGVSCRSFLRAAAGLPPAVASAVVHCAEIPISLISGISHWKLRNVDRRLLLRLMLPGALGGVFGAWLLTNIGDTLEPLIDVYLVVMGIIILFKALRQRQPRPRQAGAYVYPLGFCGGFLDAVGGGGWGPVVTSTMVATGHDVKKTIGTVNMAEFLVTVAQTTAFAVLMVEFTQYLYIIGGLLIGGMLAAPLAASLCKKLPLRPLMVLIGGLIVILNLYNLLAWTGRL